MTKSASNNQIKNWRKLLQGKHRKKTGLFLAEGLRCVEQIIKNKKLEVSEILTDGTIDHSEINLADNIPVFELSKNDFTSISDTENPQGIIAVCRIPDQTSIDSISKSGGFIVALDAVQDPGNLGTIIRTASWFGVQAILIGKGTADPFQPKVVRSTAGATGTIPYLKGDLDSHFDLLESEQWNIYLLDGSADSVSLNTVSPSNKSVIVVGNEGNGVNSTLIKANRKLVRIDGKSDIVESLNAAVAASIALFKFSDRV
ncbi:MAG: RNA methyltransferase [Balneolaceae bacterium]|nr:MAG: RNA methyltransferase [Balneolaceae bacterium]